MPHDHLNAHVQQETQTSRSVNYIATLSRRNIRMIALIAKMEPMHRFPPRNELDEETIDHEYESGNDLCG